MKKVIEMAREAGIEVDWSFDFQMRLECFAELVRADEREACANVCRQQSLLQLDERVMRGIDACTDAIRARSNT